MKFIKVFGVAIAVVALLIYAGSIGIAHRAPSGPLLIFIGAATAIGLGIDIYNHVRGLIRKARRNNLPF